MKTFHCVYSDIVSHIELYYYSATNYYELKLVLPLISSCTHYFTGYKAEYQAVF